MSRYSIEQKLAAVGRRSLDRPETMIAAYSKATGPRLLVLVMLAGWARSDGPERGHAYPPIEKLAAVCNMSTGAVRTHLRELEAAGEIVTGLLYVDPNPLDMHGHLKTSDTPLNTLQEDTLVPGAAALAKINASLR